MKADGAIEVDTSTLTVSEQVDRILGVVRQHGGADARDHLTERGPARGGRQFFKSS